MPHLYGFLLLTRPGAGRLGVDFVHPASLTENRCRGSVEWEPVSVDATMLHVDCQ